MENPHAQHIDDSGIPEASPSLLPADTDNSEESWAEASSSGYSTDSDYIFTGDEFWDEDNAAARWLARNPGGTTFLYPQLFIVKPRRQEMIETRPRHRDKSSLLNLPFEVRNRIYAHYFNKSEENEEREHAAEGYAPFRDNEGQEMDRIMLSSENQELRFCLSTALLQTSRQVRSEAMPIFFSRRVITVEWFPALPRLVEFLGREGCWMVRYLDMWDFLNLQEHNNAVYQEVISSVLHFPCLQHLRIVLSWGDSRDNFCSDRIYSWFDANDWAENGPLVRTAVPKMKSEHIESHWREYDILKTLKAQKFTLAVQADVFDEYFEGLPEYCDGFDEYTSDTDEGSEYVDRNSVVDEYFEGYVEFDRNKGGYPQLAMAMQPSVIPGKSTQSLPSSAAPISKQVLEAFKSITNSTGGTIFTPISKSEDEGFDGPTWQDTDDLTNKTIPIFNYLREFFHVEVLPGHSQDEVLANFATFPTARKSTGSIIRDCALCYLRHGHCGYHAVPDQPPYIIEHEIAGTMDRDVSTLLTRFRDLSYADMRDAGQALSYWVYTSGRSEISRTFAILDYIGWYELPNSEILERLDAAVDAGWTGQRIDKQEVPPWDVLYRELYREFFLQIRRLPHRMLPQEEGRILRALGRLGVIFGT